MATSTRIASIVKAFDKADQKAKVQALDAALAEIHGRTVVALEFDLHVNDAEAAAVVAERFPEKSEGAKRSQMLLVIKTASHYDALAKVARTAHAEAQAKGDKSSRVAGKYLTAAKLCRDNDGKIPTAAAVHAEKSAPSVKPALDRIAKRYADLLKAAKEEGVIVTGELKFAMAAPAAPDKSALMALLKQSGMTAKEITQMLKD